MPLDRLYTQLTVSSNLTPDYHAPGRLTALLGPFIPSILEVQFAPAAYWLNSWAAGCFFSVTKCDTLCLCLSHFYVTLLSITMRVLMLPSIIQFQPLTLPVTDRPGMFVTIFYGLGDDNKMYQYDDKKHAWYLVGSR